MLQFYCGCPQFCSMAATAASWALYGLAHKWQHDEGRPIIEEQVERVLPLIAALLGLASLAPG